MGEQVEVQIRWSREELILALDLYLRSPEARGNAQHPEVRALSKLLRDLPANRKHLLHDPKFRNPSGVGMKLSNFSSIDPKSTRGLSRSSHLDQEVWEEFAGDRERLRRIAYAIREHLASETPPAVDPDDLGEEASEGALLTAAHCRRERNPGIVRRKKEKVLAAHGALACVACGFEFGKRYGSRGDGFIECHHVVPVSELAPGSRTRLDDLVLLCSNCHRMVHRRRPWLSVEELRELVAEVS